MAEAERAELEARARRYTSPYFDVARARIVLYVASPPARRPILHLPTVYGISETTVWAGGVLEHFPVVVAVDGAYAVTIRRASRSGSSLQQCPVPVRPRS